MSSECDRRRHRRLSLQGEAYGLQFRLLDRSVTTARLVNLSAGGVGLELPMSESAGLEVGSTLHALFVDHPDLPYLPLQATVVRVLGKVPGKTTGYLLVGAEFMGLTAFVEELIDAHVEARLS